MISDLPRDLAEEVLCRLPVTSLREVRAACKKWNTLSKDQSFTRKHLAQAKARELMVVMDLMVMDFRVTLLGIKLHGVHEGVDPSISHQGKLVSLNDSDRVDFIHDVYHCDGLLLCMMAACSGFVVVWNPYMGQTLWLEPRSPHLFWVWYSYAIGYDSSKPSRNYKVLRFAKTADYEIYELNSNSWRVIDITSDWEIEWKPRGISLKGNTYWSAKDKNLDLLSNNVGFLICFNFTSESFGPRLPLPCPSRILDTVVISSVREEQLALLFKRHDNLTIEIWVTTKVEPEVVSWSKLFLAVDMQPLTGFQFDFRDGNFFIDEEKRVVVVFDKDKHVMNNTAHIIGEDGYYREVDLGGSNDKYPFPLVCSYVPSSAQIKQGAKKEESATQTRRQKGRNIIRLLLSSLQDLKVCIGK